MAQVHLRTRSLEKSLAFYSGVLGLTVRERAGATASLSAAESAPAFLLLTEDPKAPAHPARATGLFHLAIRYPSRQDLAQALLRLAANHYPVTQRSYPGALFFAAGNYHHHIATNTWAGKAPPPEDSLGLISYRMEVPSQETLLSLRERAERAGYEMRKASAPGQALLAIRDPNGNWLELAHSTADAR
jgi:catechol-2,3-dioxygenase